MNVRAAGGQVPRVIDRELLEHKAELQGLQLEQLRNISLHSLNILKIDHLWIFPKLTILKLNGNVIEKIENIETLINLTELNLSFNKINKLENIEKLVKLEKLLLHSNKICKLEGLDTLQQLQLLSASKNQLDSLDNVIYLRKLKNLKAISLEENPLCEITNYKEYTIAFLPNLRYYDYTLVERLPEYEAKYRQQLLRLQEEEAELALHEGAAEEKRRRLDILREAFVDMLDVADMLSSLEQKPWTSVLQVGGEAVTSIQNEYKEQMQKVCGVLQELGMAQLAERREEQNQFRECLQRATEDNRQESMGCVSTFLEPKEEMYCCIRKNLNVIEKKKAENEDFNTEVEILKDIVYKFNKEVEALWNSLMVLEIELQEQIEDVTQLFEVNMAALVKGFLEKAKTLLLQACDLEEQFYDRIQDPCHLAATNLRLLIHDATNGVKISEEAKNLISDPAILRDCLTECHEERLQAIRQREEQLEATCQSWLTKLVKELNLEAFKRSRSRILEINNFLDIQKKEISDLQPTSIAFIGLL